MKKIKEDVVVVDAYKGFSKELACRGFKYELGNTYEHEGEVKACNGGFHACESPIDVFSYYPPAESRYATVQISGELSREDGGDTKIASAKITIVAEINVHEIVAATIKYVISKAKLLKKSVTDKDRSAASATGYRSAASATGDQSAASATGYQSACMTTGRYGKVMAKEGCAMFLVERDDDWNIINVWSGIAGKDGVLPETWYTLTNGFLAVVE